ncbi:MAG: hypothetical protein HBSAPP02_28230 [Phycisphaerae bacterium]|nr:MAG: hypothetical protein HBSAPP02_28230 [Phycisphaerae bacterium]
MPIAEESGAFYGADECCDRGDQPATPAPLDPCKNVTCFCSPFVMHETGGNVAALAFLTAATPFQTDTCGIDPFSILFPHALMEPHAFPGDSAEFGAALPLLI